MKEDLFTAAKWRGDHFSMEAICNLHEDLGIMEDENGYDLEVDLNDKYFKVRMDQWVVIENGELFVQDKKPEWL